MHRSDTIFDSKAEREVYRSLESRFGDAGRLVPQLPLAKLVRAEQGDLTEREFSFFLKANVDYTFCDAHGRPLLSVEFDGIGGGYSRNGQYVPERLTKDPNRVWKLDFKLRLARSVGYPLLVVSFDETQVLGEGESLTILDGIVGYFLARQHGQRMIEEAIEQLDLEGVPDDLGHELAQDAAWGAEIQAELDHDPLVRAAAEIETRIGRTGHFAGECATWLYDPPLPDVPSIFGGEGFPTFEQLETRMRMMNAANRVGARAEVWMPSTGGREQPISETVWLRNVGSEFGTTTMIAENIAHYLALRRLEGAMWVGTASP